MPDSIYRPIAARGQWRSYALIGAIFVALLVVALVTSWIAIEVVNDTRAYATGEGRYSKGEKMAVLDLYRYADSRRQADYDAFLRDISVPRGDRDARLALSAPTLDREAAVDGMLRGNNHPSDVNGLIRLFRWFYWWKPFARAVDDWRTADNAVDRLITEGKWLHALVDSGNLDEVTRAQSIATIGAIDNAITERENTFSTHMGEAARQATFLVISGLAALTVLLWAIGTFFAALLFRKQMRLDAQLSESERRFRDYADVASDWYWEMDRDNRVTYLSSRFEDIVGTQATGVIGRKVTEVIARSAQDPAQRDSALSAVAAREPFRAVTLQFRSNDGKCRYCALSAKPVFDGVGAFQGYRGTGWDITTEVRAAHKLLEAKARAETANRAKSEFLANMSHELRTPLNAILGFSDIIAQKLFGPASPRYSDYAVDIHKSGTHLLALINDILDLSKIEAGRAEMKESAIALERIAHEVRTLLGDRVSPNTATFHIAVPDGLTVYVDQRKFVQILLNLASNALKFTPPEGSVTLSAQPEDDGGVSIIIRDTGIGIAAADIETVLSPFGQIESVFSRKHHGTGLGVPLAKSLTELHGGTLTLESIEGSGTTVTVKLPSQRVLSPLRATRASVA